MRSPKESALTGARAIISTVGRNKYKRFPAFGNKLMLLRRSGKVPAQITMVVFDWKIARAYPSIIIEDNYPPKSLEFGYLSGIPVQIVYRSKDASRIDVLSQEILKTHPSFLSSFAMDLIDTGEATIIIKPLQNTQTVEDLCA